MFFDKLLGIDVYHANYRQMVFGIENIVQTVSEMHRIVGVFGLFTENSAVGRYQRLKKEVKLFWGNIKKTLKEGSKQSVTLKMLDQLKK